jgi:hypothetical protein
MIILGKEKKYYKKLGRLLRRASSQRHIDFREDEDYSSQIIF